MDISKKKGRKRSSDPQKWRQNINKVLRNTGNSYESKKKETVPPRQVKPPCTERCRLKCSEKFTSVQRQALFAAFWAIGDIDKQRLFINSCMSNVSPRYKYTNALHPRQSNKAFHFVMDGKTIRVCKTFFIATLNISDRVIRTVKQKCDKLGIIQCDPRGKHNNHRTNDESLILDIKKFIDAIPRIESHYTRQTSTREYIDGAKSIKDIFKDFKENKNYISWNDIKIIKCEKGEPFAFFVKSSYKDNEFKKICVRNKRKKMKPLSELTTVKAYTGKQELSENKKKDLKELVDKNLIPHFYKDFYDTIL
ncbi:uncharacterized protein LOC119837403 isoform X2 [Zerene cesonia]|uniref:uncharacterized protein LOC119837403 isoform X2 n=1 Tax=Zerene cesonia TaxID=33412 RepID=UPI0018E5530E|nr:uncharacterized protein LOC119837403 isoform X2 [Zerene cesonia]